MKKHNLLIIGSNFGMIHANAANLSKKFYKIAICSPNIKIKKINKNYIVYDSYHEAISKFRFDIITVATIPIIQHKILRYLIKKKIKVKFIFFEKPLLLKTIILLKKKSNLFLFDVNFIFSFDEKWVFFKKIIHRNYKKILYFSYKWFFKQDYFLNFTKTWKIRPEEGGGLINYYLPHAIYNIFNIFPNARFINIKKVKIISNILIYLELIFKIDNRLCVFLISNNSNKKLHQIAVFFKDNKKYLLENKSKKWIKNFKITPNKKKFFKKNNSKVDERTNVLLSFYSKINYFLEKKKIKARNNNAYKAFNVISLINKKMCNVKS
jgi:hypothetical protein